MAVFWCGTVSRGRSLLVIAQRRKAWVSRRAVTREPGLMPSDGLAADATDTLMTFDCPGTLFCGWYVTARPPLPHAA